MAWTYDRYGNRTAQSETAGVVPTNSPSVSTTTNQITSLGGTSFTYDAGGNLVQDDQYEYVYDGENRLVTLKTTGGTTIASYQYDGNSMRNVKVWDGGRTFYLYSGSKLISEFGDASTNTYTSGTTPGAAGSDSVALFLYHHADTLSTRLTTDNSGYIANQQWHYPFGDIWYSEGTADASVERKFTSYLQDAEGSSGQLQYALHREYFARLGRFQSPDQKGGQIAIPQSLNRYAYVQNNPINAMDPTGQDCVGIANATDGSISVGVTGGVDDNCTTGQTFINGTVNPGSFFWNGSSLYLGYTDDPIFMEGGPVPPSFIVSSVPNGCPSNGNCGYTCSDEHCVAIPVCPSNAMCILDDQPADTSNTPAPQAANEESWLSIFGSSPAQSTATSQPTTPGGGAQAQKTQQQPQNKPCPAASRVKSTIEALEATSDALIYLNVAEVHFYLAGSLVAAGCLEPTPFEPLTCGASSYGAVGLSAAGGVLTWFGIHQAASAVSAVKQAISCGPES